MTREQAKGLKAGDRVFWLDPEGYANRFYTIAKIEPGADDFSDPILITDQDGSELGCYASELQFPEYHYKVATWHGAFASQFYVVRTSDYDDSDWEIMDSFPTRQQAVARIGALEAA